MKFLILLFILFMSFVGLAQQTPQFGLYMMNRYLYNPAFTGYEDYWDIKTGYRQQWTSFNTNMSSFYVTVNMAFDKTDRTSSGKTPFISRTIRRTFTPTRIRRKTYKANFHQGLGLQAMADNFGPLSSISLGTSYGYHLSLGGEKNWRSAPPSACTNEVLA
jgi:type IX secretion system PorP/SprF family membrane protein